MDIKSSDKSFDAVVEDITPRVRIEEFSGKHLDNTYAVMIWFLKDSYFIWIGTGGSNNDMTNISLSMMTRYESLPVVSNIMGSDNAYSQQVSQRLSIRTKKHVYASCNLPDIPELVSFVEKQIIKKILESDNLKN